MILFVMLLFFLLGLCALVIDLGMVRINQRKMQSAADTAALEVFRRRDNALIAAAEANPFVAGVFEDQVDPLSNEVDSLEFREKFDKFAYQPQLKSNAANDPTGDIVLGGLAASTEDSSMPVERDDYSRSDFHVKENPHDRVLVRLRRTNESFTEEQSASSTGSPLPLLFASDPRLPTHLKQNGVSVRATAIASHGSQDLAELKTGESGEKGRVMSAGPAWTDTSGHEHARHAGVTPLCLDADGWELLNVDVAENCGVSSAGQITRSGGSLIGNVMTPVDLAIGQIIELSQDEEPLAVNFPDRENCLYVPIYTTIADKSHTVIGFGWVEWSFNEETAELALTKRDDRVALGNVSTTLSLPLPPDFSDQPNDDDFTELWSAHRNLQNALFSPPPVLLNRYSHSTPLPTN